MERFIDKSETKFETDTKIFKIQYGEIYSLVLITAICLMQNLKSSMERFIASLPVDDTVTIGI